MDKLPIDCEWCKKHKAVVIFERSNYDLALCKKCEKKYLDRDRNG